jgi:excisionase family DNA binding protein
MEERHVPLSTVAGRLGVSERTVRRWIKAGKLRAYRPGRDYRIPESALREFVEESEISPKATRRSSLEQSFNDLLAEERHKEERRAAYDIVLETARRQREQDRQAAARAEESERPQTYWARHENEAVIQLAKYPPDQLASILFDLMYRYLLLEEAYEHEHAASEENAETPRRHPG